MPAFEVKVFEQVPVVVTQAMLHKRNAEQLANLPKRELKIQTSLGFMAEGHTAHEAKALAKAKLLPELRKLHPPKRLLSCSVLSNPVCIQVIIERIPAPPMAPR